MIFLLDSDSCIQDTVSMKIGLAGYSGSGVTTVLALLSEDMELVGKHSGPEIRSITVNDPRLDKLNDFFKPKKLTRLHIDLTELGDLRPDEGGGLRRDTLNRAAGLDALVIVLRAFEAPLSQTCRKVDELSGELESLLQEFILTDLLPIESRLEHLGKEGKLSSREAQLLAQVKDNLEDGVPVRRMELGKEESKSLAGFNFLTLAPTIVIANVGAEGARGPAYPDLLDRCPREGLSYIEIPALAELETLEIPSEERGPFFEDLGIAQPAPEKFMGALFSLLDLVTFYTVSDKEIRAWTVPEGTPAAGAAGKIHTDMERGFIRAEIISVNECITLGGLAQAREAGRLRVEGKDYRLKDGEIVQVRFNV